MDVSGLMMLFSTPLGLHIKKMALALIIIVAIALISKLIQIAVLYICRLIRLDGFASQIKLTELLQRTELKSSATELLGDIVFWALLLLGGVALIYAMNFERAIYLLRFMLSYISTNVVSAAFVLVVSVIFASLLSGLILFVGELIFLPGYKFIARINQYVIVVFGIVVGLDKLGISTAMLTSKWDIILGFFALSGAIAFGLGCKDIAASFLANFLRGR